MPHKDYADYNRYERRHGYSGFDGNYTPVEYARSHKRTPRYKALKKLLAARA